MTTIYNATTGKEVTKLDQIISHDDLIDELYPKVTIGIYQWSPSWVLERMDAIAYAISLAQHVDEMIESGAWYEYEPTEEDIAQANDGSVW